MFNLLFTWKIKAALTIALLLGAWWYMGRLQTRAYHEGQAQGRIVAFAEAEKAAKARWEADNLLLTELRQQLEQDKTRTAQERQSIEQLHREFRVETQRTLGAIASQNIEDRQHATTLPAPELVPAIRGALDGLRGIERLRSR